MHNCFEERSIDNSCLPQNWQSQSAQNELEEFLQANWEQRSAFYDDGFVASRQQFIKFEAHNSIKTQQYIGTIVFKGEQLNIFPKVCSKGKRDDDASHETLEKLMGNLVNWLEYCNKVDYPFISIKSELDDCNNLQDLFITLYVRYVQYAIERGLYYRYVEETDDVSVIKGRINIANYFTRKFPNGQLDKFNCTFSTFEFNNKLNQIIKYTCKQLNNVASKQNQFIIRHILYKLSEVSDKECTPTDCDGIRLSKMHRNYSVIVSMSKMFLLNKMASYRVDSSESFCFLFPTDVLFEGFIAGFIKSILQGEARVQAQASDMSLIKNVRVADKNFGKKSRLMNDILVQTNDGRVFVLDTKYKEIKRIEGNDDPADEISEKDIYQVKEYARKRNLHQVYLLYPLYATEDVEPDPVTLEDSYENDGVEYPLDVIAYRLPFIFEEDIELTKQKLTAVIESIFC